MHLTGHVELRLSNQSAQVRKVRVRDASYQQKSTAFSLAPNEQKTIVMDLKKSHGWYDVVVEVDGFSDWSERFAGHVETGQVSQTDPLMGGMYFA